MVFIGERHYKSYKTYSSCAYQHNYIPIMASMEDSQSFTEEEDDKSLTILLLGEPGIGKSTLVNGLVGQCVAEVSKKADIATQGVTRELKDYYADAEGVAITIWDTPGLLDPTIKTEKTLEEVKNISKTIDLFLFCINMNKTRVFHEGDETAMINMITKFIGKEFWKKGLVVLVRANSFIYTLKDQYSDNEERVIKAYKENIKSWKKLLRDKIPVSGIKVVPVGYFKKPKIFHGDKLPWLSRFWKKAYKQLPKQKQRALTKISFNRLLVCSESGVLRPISELCSDCQSDTDISPEEQDSLSSLVRLPHSLEKQNVLGDFSKDEDELTDKQNVVLEDTKLPCLGDFSEDDPTDKMEKVNSIVTSDVKVSTDINRSHAVDIAIADKTEEAPSVQPTITESPNPTSRMPNFYPFSVNTLSEDNLPLPKNASSALQSTKNEETTQPFQLQLHEAETPLKNIVMDCSGSGEAKSTAATSNTPAALEPPRTEGNKLSNTTTLPVQSNEPTDDSNSIEAKPDVERFRSKSATGHSEKNSTNSDEQCNTTEQKKPVIRKLPRDRYAFLNSNKTSDTSDCRTVHPSARSKINKIFLTPCQEPASTKKVVPVGKLSHDRLNIMLYKSPFNDEPDTQPSPETNNPSSISRQLFTSPIEPSEVRHSRVISSEAKLYLEDTTQTSESALSDIDVISSKSGACMVQAQQLTAPTLELAGPLQSSTKPVLEQSYVRDPSQNGDESQENTDPRQQTELVLDQATTEMVKSGLEESYVHIHSHNEEESSTTATLEPMPLLKDPMQRQQAKLPLEQHATDTIVQQEKITTSEKSLPSSPENTKICIMNNDFIAGIERTDLEEQPIIISEGFFGKIKRMFRKLFR